MRQDWKTTWNDSQQNPLKVRAELVAGFRLAQPAQLDLAGILSTSAERWGAEGRRRYAAILAAAMRKIAADPEGLLRQLRDEFLPGLRSFHIHTRASISPRMNVKRPVHTLLPQEPAWSHRNHPRAR